MWRFDSDTDPGYWVRVDSPTNVTLRDLTSSANGPVAVGDKGVAIGRGRERWGIILENGPGAKSRALYAVDTTDDGERVWFAGAGGAFGYYDIVEEERRDYSVPRGNSNGFYALAVAGQRGEEKFLVGDGSGHVLPGHVEDDETDWSWSTTPNDGNAVQALAHDDDGYGYGVTANGNVFMTTEEEEWEQVGVARSQNSFYDCGFGDGVFVTGGGGGMLYEADKLLDHDDDVVWTPTDLGGFGIYGLDAGHGGQLACGEGGNVYLRQTGGEWAQGRFPDTTSFHAGLIDEQMVLVGGNGLVVERRRREELSAEQRERFGVEPRPEPEHDTSTAEAEWTRTSPEGEERGSSQSADGDAFDGRGELYDGDGRRPADSEMRADVSEDRAAAGSDDSGNDSADPPDGTENDVAGDPGNDESDPPDEPDGVENDVAGDPGNDEADPPDPNTDSDADSPDS